MYRDQYRRHGTAIYPGPGQVYRIPDEAELGVDSESESPATVVGPASQPGPVAAARAGASRLDSESDRTRSACQCQCQSLSDSLRLAACISKVGGAYFAY